MKKKDICKLDIVDVSPDLNSANDHNSITLDTMAGKRCIVKDIHSYGILVQTLDKMKAPYAPQMMVFSAVIHHRHLMPVMEEVRMIEGNSIYQYLLLWKGEMEKCKKSPYYFYKNYWKVNGKKPTTFLSEKDFNKLFI